MSGKDGGGSPPQVVEQRWVVVLLPRCASGEPRPVEGLAPDRDFPTLSQRARLPPSLRQGRHRARLPGARERTLLFRARHHERLPGLGRQRDAP